MYEEGYKPPPHPAEWKLLLACLAPGLAGLIGVFASPDGANIYSLGSVGLMAAAVIIYASGISLLRRTGTFDSSLRWFIRMGGFLALIAGGVGLIGTLSGTVGSGSDAAYSALWALLGAGAILYGYYYRTNTRILDLLGPLGFRLAESGPFARDGNYDVRGEWKGVTTLVNVNQSLPYKNCPASFFLEVCCEIKESQGRRLLLHPKGYFSRSLGLPLFIPSDPAKGWENYGVYGEPQGAAAGLLSTLGAEAGAAVYAHGFAYLLAQRGRLRLGYSGEGYPSRAYVTRRLDIAAAAAKKL